MKIRRQQNDIFRVLTMKNFISRKKKKLSKMKMKYTPRLKPNKL